MTKPLPTMVDANGTQLYYETARGGPRLLIIPGAEGDAEEYARVVALLQNEFTVLSYDRRGYSRSPRPEGYAAPPSRSRPTTRPPCSRPPDSAPATVWGNSSGAIIGLSLVLRHPGARQRAPCCTSPRCSPAPSDAGGRCSAGCRQATANGKVPFLKMLTGDVVYDSFSEGYKERLAADRTWIDLRVRRLRVLPALRRGLGPGLHPSGGAVRRPTARPSSWKRPPGWPSGWARAVGVIPGNHGVHYSLPDEVAKAIRDFAAEG